MLTQERPMQSFVGLASGRQVAVSKGTELSVGYFEFKVFLPRMVIQIGDSFSDSELLIAAEQAGTFKFWDGPEEDIYNDRRK